MWMSPGELFPRGSVSPLDIYVARGKPVTISNFPVAPPPVAVLPVAVMAAPAFVASRVVLGGVSIFYIAVLPTAATTS